MVDSKVTSLGMWMANWLAGIWVARKDTLLAVRLVDLSGF